MPTRRVEHGDVPSRRLGSARRDTGAANARMDGPSAERSGASSAESFADPEGARSPGLRPAGKDGGGAGSDVFLEELRYVTQQLVTKLAPLLKFSEDMQAAIRVLCQNEARFARHDQIIAAGQPYSNVFLVRTGWAVRYKLLESGLRQIVNFVLPGDFMCYNAALFPKSDFYLAAQTEVTAYVVPIHPFKEMLSSQPDLTLVLSWANSHEESLLAERIVSLGRRTAKERMAHLFCELWRRLRLLELTDGGQFPLPLTQEDLADTLGLSAVHVNRTLRKLREEGLIATTAHRIEVLDMAGLERTAGFDSGYLHFLELPSRY